MPHPVLDMEPRMSTSAGASGCASVRGVLHLADSRKLRSSMYSSFVEVAEDVITAGLGDEAS